MSAMVSGRVPRCAPAFETAIRHATAEIAARASVRSFMGRDRRAGERTSSATLYSGSRGPASQFASTAHFRPNPTVRVLLMDEPYDSPKRGHQHAVDTGGNSFHSV